jgi:hypothetical protein
MTSFIPTGHFLPYRVSDDLREDRIGRAVYQPAPGEADREELLLRKLGPRGWGRLHHFRHYYEPGWGEGKGRQLSPRALEGFFLFLGAADFPPGKAPSIFLTDRGGLELAWEDRNGMPVQVEFTPHGAEFYTAAKDAEGQVPAEALEQLAAELAA